MKIRGQTIEERLSRKSSLDEKTGCINWTGGKRSGYGRLWVGSRIDGSRKNIGAHRLSYEIHKGEIPDGMYVCHHCDNRSCINPDHLFIGTHYDNMMDRESKGRNKLPNPLRGEDCPTSKLTWDQVREMRAIGDDQPQKDLAEKYGVKRRTIWDVLNYRTWASPPKQEV